MTEEQRNAVLDVISHVKGTIDELEKMLSDYDNCKSGISQKVLGAAVIKMSAQLKLNAQ